ncbi:hypothetical protein BGW38_005235 [Lunasporangiospora selenospora]|uniref:Glutathione S-transferase n=1 Tax=Lunasporangiospora selenospora TaxID=979761 RepID=A0A9P6KBL7_9FUNG|nr:hypothetical protein BGW38_005235 [Lunasporangiospora selenospora]
MLNQRKVLPTATKASSEVLSKAMRDAANTKSTYTLLYFGVHGLGEVTRSIFVYADVEYEPIIPDWPAMKAQTPFGYLPVLYETTSTGVVLELTESSSVERYLARKFNLLGANEMEEHRVGEYVNSACWIWSQILSKFLFSPVETRNQTVPEFYKGPIASWTQIHERHLRENGSNGHYVGNAFTWADLRTLALVQILLIMVPKGLERERDEVFSPEVTPELWRLRETALAHPRLGKWLRSEKYDELTDGTKEFFKF